ncbi:ArsR/SmtB family transcription factor [Lihuaxuella thermophila]|uniref:DNA-binding transcriptional regulator, ArsR family n=1 Tax=Lihuaxuella thermophila TaxID=1173111 RepID=A0A1H8ATL3_9BACL|nr:metalloregulator ArsR/SmtB family transcription factor [Lihuaxuella thermophila]SEM74050.1 DNA-binding transcriptional regulator, ArsR family [Lihuaxuella thermophila]
MSKDHCEIYCYDEEKVKRVQASLATVDPIDTAQLFKALADPTRLKIAYALVQEDELCVCDVANIIDSSLATASHHLRLLRTMGLAKYRKEGKLVFYSLDDDHVKQLVQLAFAHRKELITDGASPR